MADYDGDGKADLVVFRHATKVWYRLNSSDNKVQSDAIRTKQRKPHHPERILVNQRLAEKAIRLNNWKELVGGAVSF